MSAACPAARAEPADRQGVGERRRRDVDVDRPGERRQRGAGLVGPAAGAVGPDGDPPPVADRDDLERSDPPAGVAVERVADRERPAVVGPDHHGLGADAVRPSASTKCSRPSPSAGRQRTMRAIVASSFPPPPPGGEDRRRGGTRPTGQPDSQDRPPRNVDLPGGAARTSQRPGSGSATAPLTRRSPHPAFGHLLPPEREKEDIRDGAARLPSPSVLGEGARRAGEGRPA